MKPFFTLSRKTILAQYQKCKALADIVSYSSKTNPKVTPILEDKTDSLFSIHLTNELKNIKDLSRVLFLAQGWSAALVRDLLAKGIRRFVVDNEPDLDILLEALDSGQIDLFLRVKLKENTLRTERYFVFGMPSETVARRILALKGHPGISSLGIHFHRKTQNMAEWNLQFELEGMFPKEVFEAVDIVNIGGGLPSEYANTNSAVLASIESKLRSLRSWLSSQQIKLMLEPGRFIAAPAGCLHTHIIRVYDDNIIVNASVYNSDMDAIIVPVKLLVDGELSKDHPEARPFVIKGLTPCSLDLFRYRVYLKDPKVGDELVFLNAGAYSFSSDFCDLEPLDVRLD